MKRILAVAVFATSLSGFGSGASAATCVTEGVCAPTITFPRCSGSAVFRVAIEGETFLDCTGAEKIWLDQDTIGADLYFNGSKVNDECIILHYENLPGQPSNFIEVDNCR